MQRRNNEVPVTCVAHNLSKLPPVTFDSIDVCVLLSRIEHMRLEMDTSQDRGVGEEEESDERLLLRPPPDLPSCVLVPVRHQPQPPTCYPQALQGERSDAEEEEVR